MKLTHEIIFAYLYKRLYIQLYIIDQASSMSTDFLDELAELALGSRLKRLSERMLANASLIYKEFGMQINPKWFTLMALLDARYSSHSVRGEESTLGGTDLTIVEASSLLGLSQPALSQFCKQLQNERLITVTKGKVDSRQRVIKLTEYGKQTIAQMKPIWKLVNQAAVDLCTENDNNFYHSLLAFENAYNAEDLLCRTRRCHKVRKQSINACAPEVSFIPFKPELAHYFETINKQWIDDMFVLEDIDKQVLEEPQRYIIENGGKIWFAKHHDLGIVGTCALLKKDNDSYELTKMGVLPSARGLKVGELLLQHVIEQAKQLSISCLYLLTNNICEAAIHLYEKNGFVHDSEIMQTYGGLYQRCDVAMRYPLENLWPG